MFFDLSNYVWGIVLKWDHFAKETIGKQAVRAFDSNSANIAEGRGRRVYENEFKKHLVYAMGSVEETKVWLCFAKDCQYIPVEIFVGLNKRFDELGARLYKLYENWKTL